VKIFLQLTTAVFLLAALLIPQTRVDWNRQASGFPRTFAELNPIEMRMGPSGKWLFFQTSLGVLGPFTSSVQPAPGKFFQSVEVPPPTVSSAACNPGEWAQDSIYLYYCLNNPAVGGNVPEARIWRRVKQETGW